MLFGYRILFWWHVLVFIKILYTTNCNCGLNYGLRYCHFYRLYFISYLWYCLLFHGGCFLSEFSCHFCFKISSFCQVIYLFFLNYSCICYNSLNILDYHLYIPYTFICGQFYYRIVIKFPAIWSGCLYRCGEDFDINLQISHVVTRLRWLGTITHFLVSSDPHFLGENSAGRTHLK